MKINTWFNSGCDYKSGILLYSSVSGHSTNLLRLFNRKQTASNLEKLKYELGKHKGQTVSIPIKKTFPPGSITAIPLAVPIVNLKQENKTSNGFYSLNQLHPDLHTLAIAQRNNFQTAISLHLQLTQLHTSEEGVALTLCIEIENLFDAIEATQKVLDHYRSHKIVLNTTPRDYKSLTAPQLIQTRNNKRVSVSKYEKKIAVLKTQLQQVLSKSNQTKTEVALEKSESKLLQHKLELQQLNELINSNE